VWTCKECHKDWSQAGLLFCSYCGAQRPATGDWRVSFPLAVSAQWSLTSQTGGHGPFHLARRPHGVLGWCANDTGILLLNRDDDGLVAVNRLVPAEGTFRLDKASSLRHSLAPIMPPLAGRHGVYLVGEQQILYWLNDTSTMQIWSAPADTQILGATISRFGEIWLALRRGAAIMLWAGSGREAKWREVAAIPNFGEVSGLLSLAVDSCACRRGAAMLWGAGRAAATDDGGLVGLCDVADAPVMPLGLQNRIAYLRDQQLPSLAQPIWQRDRPFLVHGTDGFGVLNWSAGPPRWTPPPQRAPKACAVALTGLGRALAVSKQLCATINFDQRPPSIAGEISFSDPCERALALAFQDEVLFVRQFAEGVHVNLLRATDARPSEEGQAIVTARDRFEISTVLPPLEFDGFVWAAFVRNDGLVGWRAPLRSWP
jgi:hypothetical protein